jgi:hypothetical protein
MGREIYVSAWRDDRNNLGVVVQADEERERER